MLPRRNGITISENNYNTIGTHPVNNKMREMGVSYKGYRKGSPHRNVGFDC